MQGSLVLLRVVIALGGLSFIVTGIALMLSSGCRSVVWGPAGSDRAGTFTATCHDLVVEGGMSQGMASLVSIAAGTVLVVAVAAPTLRKRLSQSSKG